MSMSDAVAFAASEAIAAGEWDRHLHTIQVALTRRRQELEDPNHPPPRTTAMIASGHQVWAWMNGPGKPHWEVRGTGARL